MKQSRARRPAVALLLLLFAAPAGDRRVDTIMLSGYGGQKVYLVPSLDLVVAFTGGAFGAESPVNEMMAGVLLPALLGAAPPPRR